MVAAAGATGVLAGPGVSGLGSGPSPADSAPNVIPPLPETRRAKGEPAAAVLNKVRPATAAERLAGIWGTGAPATRVSSGA